MSRLIDQPIQVTAVLGRDGLTPAWFIWRGAWYRVVEVLDSWMETGRWWEHEVPCTAFRVQVQDGGVMELIRLHTEPPTWRLMRIWD